ncbi:MAG: hypothetical protein U1F21_14175 [Sphaerotilus natans]
MRGQGLRLRTVSHGFFALVIVALAIHFGFLYAMIGQAYRAAQQAAQRRDARSASVGEPSRRRSAWAGWCGPTWPPPSHAT